MKRAQNETSSKTRRKLHVVFVETWTNPIYLRFAREFAHQHPTCTVTFVTDADAPRTQQSATTGFGILRVPNSTVVRKLVYLPLYLASFVSLAAKEKYSDTLYLHTYRGLTRVLSDLKPDLVQGNVLLMPCTMQAGRYARLHGIPFVLRTEERDPGTARGRAFLRVAAWLNRRTLRHTYALLPWTSHGEAYARRELRRYCANIHCMPAGIDTEQFRPPARTAKTAGNRARNTPLRLLTVQRFVPYKDYDTLLGAVRIARDGGATLHLTIVGEGPLEDSVRARVASLDLADSVTFLKNIPYSTMPELYSRHDLLVHTARNEAIGMVVPEAMACGIPALVSDSAGATTYLTKNTGMTFRTGDPKDLAKKMRILTRATAATLGRAAAKHIAKHYSMRATVAQYSRVIAPLLAGGHRD